jgi:hypothetical protein
MILLWFVFMPLTTFVFSDDVAYKLAIEYLENTKKKRIPNDEDYFQICSFSETSFLSSTERLKVWREIVSLQNSDVSLLELQSIFKSKQNSLRDARVTYTEHVYDSRKSDQPTIESSRTYTFAFMSNMLYLERKGKRMNGDYDHAIFSYDGKSMKTVIEPNSDLPNANIMKKTPLTFFFQIDMPLFSAMLFDPSLCNSSWHFNFNIISFLGAEKKTRVFQQDIFLNGKKYLAVLDLSTKIYLDPEKDFSVVRFEKYSHNFERIESELSSVPNIRLIGRSLIFRSDLSDLINYDNGIWIPSKIENTIFLKDRVIERAVVSVENVQINQNIPKSFFEDIIPENSFVFDAPNNLTYKQSDSPSINSLIKDTVKSKRILIYRYISIISGLALIFIALIMKFLAYLKAKRERKNKTVVEEKTK